MIRQRNHDQLSLLDFEWPFQQAMDENNRWVQLSNCIPWPALEESYHQSLSKDKGRPGKDARLVIGAVIIKHKLCLSDRETVAQIQENPYLQYFVGLPGYQSEEPFVPSLFVEIRKRMGQQVFDAFQSAIIDSLEQRKAKPGSEDREPPQGGEQTASSTPSEEQIVREAVTGEASQEGTEPQKRGKLIIDATVTPQAIRYPTDLSLLNEAREFSEQIIDHLYPHTELQKKPRTYRQKARSAYLAIAKRKKAGARLLRRGIKQQLQYLRRNLGHIEQLLNHFEEGRPLPLPNWLLHRYWVIQQLYQQQREMYDSNSRRCDDRIVSISQPYVRPIVRGKQSKPVEFGAKLSASLNGDGVACVDHLSWDAFNEGGDLKNQVKSYYQRHGHLPEVVIADPVYGTRANRSYLKQQGIRFAGKPLGRPPKITEENREEQKRLKAQRREEYLQRIPIEGKFGQGKNGYRLNYIRAKRANTSVSWINSIFLVMNLLVLLKHFFAPGKRAVTGWSEEVLACLVPIAVVQVPHWLPRGRRWSCGLSVL